MNAPLWLDIALYCVGIVVGVAANLAFDVQLRRPGMRQSIGLVMFAILLWAVLSVTHTEFTQIVLPLVWFGTGVLAGIGSRGVRSTG